MSYEIGWQAINLQMPERIGHTEYCSHPLLVKAVTGADPRDDPAAWLAFYDAVGYDFIWSCNDGPAWTGRVTSMGHAVFEQDGVDFDPQVTSPFRSPDEVLRFDPVAEYGIPDVAERSRFLETTYLEAQRTHKNQVFPGGYYKTLFSACIHSFGWDMFLTSAGMDAEAFDRVLDGFFQISLANYRAWAQTSAPVFICHDDITWSEGPVFHPDWYRRYVFPRYRQLWAPLREAGKKILFCSDGDLTAFIDDIADAGADGFIFEPMTDLAYVVHKYGSQKVIVGNVDTRILTFGTREEIRQEVARCIDLGKRCPGYFIAVGNHIPHNVPIENALYYFELVDELGRR